MFLKKNVIVVLFLACLAIMVPARLHGQEITGNISGTVTDTTGAAVPDANVTILNVSTGAERSTSTSSAGIFFFSNLSVGNYQLTIAKDGFKKSEITSIRVDVNDKLTFPVKLELGAVTESITVEGQAPVLQTESAEVSNLVGNAQMKALPLNGRNFGQLVDLVPGVAPDNGRLDPGDTAVSVNGALSNSNLYLVDGTFDQDNGSNADLLVAPPVDSIEEFKILRNNYSAEFGEATGAIVNVVTKSGSKDFHGSVYEFARNDAFDAFNAFPSTDDQGNPVKDKLRQHDFGFTVGGPAWIPKVYNNDRKKDFFFVSTEFRREIRGGIIQDTVPSARQRLGILDPDCSVAPDVAGTNCTIQPADPAENVVGEPNFNGTIDPNAVAFLSRYPLPSPNADYQANGFNFAVSSPVTTNSNLEGVRWDHVLGEKATLMISFTKRKGSQLSLNTNNWGDDSFPSVSSDWFTGGELGTIKLTNIISSRTVNDFQFGYSNNFINWGTSATSDKTLASRAGFTYTELFPETSGSFPTLNLDDGFGSLQHTAPFYNRTDNFQFRDDVTHSFSKHNLKVGFFVRFSRKREPANGGDNETAGTVNVKTLGDLLAGNITNSYLEQKTQNQVPSRGRDIALYFQDNYKVFSNLTLDYGLRWQYLGQVFSSENNISSFYPSRYDASRCPLSAFGTDPTGATVIDPNLCDLMNGIVTPKTPGLPRSLKQPHYHDFEPRVGFSWDPFSAHKLLLRVGGGIYHGRDAFSQTSSAGLQPPFNSTPQINNTSFSALHAFDPLTPQPPTTLIVQDPNYPNPQSYQYSLGFQYELMHNTSLEVNYVGSRQIHAGRNVNINQVPAADQLGVWNFFNADCSDPTIVCTDPETVRPFRGFDFINVNERSATSRYNSLQIFFNRQMSHGLQFQAAYTYSRSIGTTPNQDTEARNKPVQDAYNPNREKAVTDQDIPHSLVFNYVWQLPFFEKSTGYRKALLGGWSVNGISVFRSGRPVDICLPEDNAGLGDGGVCERPNIIGNPILDKSKRSINEFFNIDAFTLPDPGTFGNGGRNPVRGSGINNWDLSIFKEANIPWFGRRSGWAAGESAKIEFRAEMFNVWNHTQFGDPHSTFGRASFGQITDARSPREIQFGLRLEF